MQVEVKLKKQELVQLMSNQIGVQRGMVDLRPDAIQVAVKLPNGSIEDFQEIILKIDVSK